MPRARPMLLCLAVSFAIAGCSREMPLTPKPGTAPSFTTGNPINADSKETYTLAVFGDFPYGQQKIDSMPLLFGFINSDPKVDIVVHLGDIKAGSNSPCTDDYFAMIATAFATFKDPLVYTPGDNEWVDCHNFSKHNGFYVPTERLQAVRNLFFPVPGQTLGGRKKQVLTQADDPANSGYVENVMWMESQVVFATFNIQGSNDDKAAWSGPGFPLPPDSANYPTQAAERAARSQANSAWLEKEFALARASDAAGVVIALQADMWDSTSALNGFDDVVKHIGNLAAAFGKPVLILEGDSHLFHVDQPFTPSSPLFKLHPSTPIAPNVTRLVVEGDGNRTEYTRLTVNPKAGALFTWERVPVQN